MNQIDYDPQFFDAIASIEDRHFWFTARKRTICAALEPILQRLHRGYRVLEIGCGTGAVLTELVRVCREGSVMGMDLYSEAVAFARKRAGCEIIVGDARNPPDIGHFDIIGAFDVIEHVETHLELLTVVRALLNPDGWLILTVPAHMFLWSYFDEAAHHKRRYTCLTLTTALRSAGLQPVYLSHFMMTTLPFIWIARKFARNLKRDPSEMARTELTIIPVINSLFRLMLSPERYLVRNRLTLPFGSSIIAIACPASTSNALNAERQ